MAQLDGKVALITGAGGMKGIGRACALKLAAQGADIVLSDFKREEKDLPPQEVKAGWRSIDSVAEEVEALGRRCLKIWCDLTVTARSRTWRGARRSITATSTSWSTTRARSSGATASPITELREEVWERFLRINTTADVSRHEVRREGS